MAVPFRKVSKTRRNMRRTHYKINANGLVKCPNCGAMIRPHRVCLECGFYKKEDRLNKNNEVVEEVVSKKEEKKTTKKKEEKKETKKEGFFVK